jgi:hypothetical protein
VVLALRPSYSARIGSPNDEALTHHPLYGKGLESVGRVGIVRDSSAVRTMRPQWSAKVLNPSGPGFIDRPMPTHYIVLVKECTVEVLANDVAIFRLDGTTLEAATCCATGPR